MQKTILILFLCSASMGFSQEFSEIRGKIITDSLQFDAIHIVNKTREIGTISDQSGHFLIKALSGDILVFSSVQHETKIYKVKDADIGSGGIVISLQRSVNKLDEVVVSQYSLTGDLENDLQEIPTYTQNLPFWNASELKKMRVSGFDDAQSPVRNLILQKPRKSINMLGLFDLLLGDVIDDINTPKPVVKEVTIDDIYNEKFIVDVLGIPSTKYYDYIDFVNENSKTTFMLKLEDKLQILEYLIEQKEVFFKAYATKN